MIALLYGIALVILGSILLGVELGGISDTCNKLWITMSTNQKAYFSNNVDNLISERSKNVSMCGSFALIIGACMIASGVTQHLLYRESEVKWKPPSTSRLPPTDFHEKVEFVYVCYRDDEYDGPH
jgi:hypothetical protein